MATQLQKYSGNNTLNNAVTVDFKKKDVKFVPIYEGKKSKSSRFTSYIELRAVIFVIGMKLLVFFFLLSFFTDYLYGWELHFNVIYGLFLSILFVFTFPYLVCLPFLNKNIANKYFPPNMAVLYFIYHLLKSELVLKKHTFSGDNLKKNITLPDFENVYLGYKLYGDAGKQAKKIIIKPFSDFDTGKWTLEFKFNRKPINGKLEVKYM